MSDVRHVRGCCPLDCQDSCSWVATVENGRVVQMRGAKEHPITRGTLCAKVNDFHGRTYAPDRVLYPLKRVGPKGEGVFRRVSWDAAIDEIAERFHTIIAAHGAEALLPFQYLGSMGVVQRRALQRLFNLLGASRSHGSVCGQSGNAIADEGFPTGMDPEEMVDARFVLVWGSNPLTTSPHTWHFLTEARKRNGARIVCIDPRTTKTARASDQHIAIRPGTDWALAAGMGREILAAGLADLEFAERVVTDVERYREMVEPWTPDRVAETCDVAPGVVVDLAHAFASARPGLLRVSNGVQQSVSGDALLRALYALPILAGHWRLPGGGHFCEAFPVLHEAAAARPDLVPGSPRSLDMARLGETLTAPPTDPAVMGLVVWNANPAVSQPDLARVREGLAREDLFTVVIEHFVTDTARYADLVLPSTTQLEHFDVQGAWGHHYISLNEPAIPPLGEALTHGEIMRLLASRMGLDHPALHESDEEIAAATLPQGLTLDELRVTRWHKSSPARFDPAATGPVLRLACDPPALPPPPADGTLQLLTPKAQYFLNSTFANRPPQQKAMQGPTLDMNPADAAPRGLVDGDRVRVHNDRAVISCSLRVTDDIRPGVVSLPGKWWAVPGQPEAVANTLTSGAWSPGGQPAYNETYVHVDRDDAPVAAPRVALDTVG